MRLLHLVCAAAIATAATAPQPAGAQTFTRPYMPRVPAESTAAAGAPGDAMNLIRQAQNAEARNDLRAAMTDYANAVATLAQPSVAQDAYPVASQKPEYFLLRAYGETEEARLAVLHPNVFPDASLERAAATSAHNDYLRAIALEQGRSGASPAPAERSKIASIYRSLGYVDSIACPLETVRDDFEYAQSIDPSSAAKTASIMRTLTEAIDRIRAHPADGPAVTKTAVAAVRRSFSPSKNATPGVLAVHLIGEP